MQLCPQLLLCAHDTVQAPGIAIAVTTFVRSYALAHVTRIARLPSKHVSRATNAAVPDRSCGALLLSVMVLLEDERGSVRSLMGLVGVSCTADPAEEAARDGA